MMNRGHSRTLEAIFATPVPANLEWRKIEALMSALGAETVEGAGSRVAFVLNGKRADFHRPHPEPSSGEGSQALSGTRHA